MCTEDLSEFDQVIKHIRNALMFGDEEEILCLCGVVHKIKMMRNSKYRIKVTAIELHNHNLKGRKNVLRGKF